MISNVSMKRNGELRLNVIDDEAYARHLLGQGTSVKHSHGTYWMETRRGFWEPTHWLARVGLEEANPPTGLCWGYRCATRGEAGTGRASLPIHLLTNVAGYDISVLDGKRRNQLRACWKRVEIVQLLDSTLLEEQGYGVVCSALKRTAHGRIPAQDEYLRGARRLMVNYPGVVLAGLIEGRLGGYLYGKAISGTGYIDGILIASEALPANIGTGLVYQFAKLCQQTGNVNEVAYGLHTPEDAHLTAYKENMLFPVERVPAKLWMLPLFRAVLRIFKPNALHRLTGCAPAAST
jgi:hypothetical protein